MGRKTPGTVETGTPEGCLFDLGGRLCGKAPRARGFCARHYKVLNRKGAWKAGSSSQPATESQVDRNLSAIARARVKLEEQADTLVDHLMTASAIAASKGNAAPAQWGLLHSRALEPVFIGGGGTAGKDGSAPQGIRVLVGVQLGTTQPGQPAMSQSYGPGTDHTIRVIAETEPAPTSQPTPQIAGDNFCRSAVGAVDAQLLP